MKKLIKKFLLRMGYRLVPYNYYSIDYYEQLDTVKHNWIKPLNINTIIDVGSSFGGFAFKIRQSFPETKLYCFEPIPQSYHRLNERFQFDPNFTSFNIACSDVEGETEFFVHAAPSTSSLLPMGKLHKKVYPGSSACNSINVKTSRLDTIFSSIDIQDNILLKIDVQGAELKVLTGAVELLERIKVVFLEVNFNELYEGNAMINEVIDFMKQYGFMLKGIENVSHDLEDGRFLQADAYFIKE